MARQSATPEVEETTAATEETTEATPKAPKRGDLPDGYITPVGFAKVLTERELHTDKNGGHEVKPQMVYSYMKNSPKEDKLETTAIADSNGVERQAFLLDEALAWWERKNTRVNERRQNAADKAAKKAERAANKETEGSSEPAVSEAE